MPHLDGTGVVTEVPTWPLPLCLTRLEHLPLTNLLVALAVEPVLLHLLLLSWRRSPWHEQ